MNNIFILTPAQLEKIEAWKATHKKVNTGAIGGRYIYQFFPTSLGQIVTVKDDMTGEELDLTNYDW